MLRGIYRRRNYKRGRAPHLPQVYTEGEISRELGPLIFERGYIQKEKLQEK